MRGMSALRVAAVAAGIALMASGCGATGKTAPAPPRAEQAPHPVAGCSIMVPNTAGGGYDTTARAAAKVMDDEKITKNLEVFNLAGAGGTVGLARIVNEKGNGDLAMLMGLGVVGASYTNKSEAEADRHHPARQADRGARRHRGAQGLARTRRSTTWSTAWKADPEGQRRRRLVARRPRPPAARCSSPRPSASTPRRSTSSPTTAAATCCRPSSATRSRFGASGFGEFLDQVEAGEVRVLAISGDEAARRRRRPDAQGVRHRPGLHQLARHRRPSRHLRRRQGRADRRPDEDARSSQSWKEALKSAAGPTPSSPATSSSTFLDGAGRARWPTILTKLGLA